MEVMVVATLTPETEEASPIMEATVAVTQTLETEEVSPVLKAEVVEALPRFQALRIPGQSVNCATNLDTKL